MFERHRDVFANVLNVRSIKEEGCWTREESQRKGRKDEDGGTRDKMKRSWFLENRLIRQQAEARRMIINFSSQLFIHPPTKRFSPSRNPPRTSRRIALKHFRPTTVSNSQLLYTFA